MSYAMAAGVGTGIGFIAFFVAANIYHWWHLKRGGVRNHISDFEQQQFRNVYAVMSEERRQSLLRYYMEKHECDRQAAMRFAVEDKARDADRWAK